MAPHRRLTRAEAETVLARAIELDAEVDEDGFTRDEVMTIGAEMGLSRSALLTSLQELGTVERRYDGGLLDRVVGPSRVVVERPIRRPAAEAGADLRRRLERLNLKRSGPGDTWVQRLDWWPDTHRISAPTVLEVEAVPASADRPAVLRVDARVDEARRNHVASAVAGAALLPLAAVGVPVALLVATSVGAVLGAIGSYRLRVRGVEQRIARMLDIVGAPGR